MTPNKTGGKVLAACLAALQLLMLAAPVSAAGRSEEHTSELQSP